MKKMFAVAVAVAVSGAAVGVSIGEAVAASPAQVTPVIQEQVDMQQVNENIDARLHVVLTQLIAQRSAR